MEKDDLKRVIGLYFGTSMAGEAGEDVDGAKNFNLRRREQRDSFHELSKSVLLDKPNVPVKTVPNLM